MAVCLSVVLVALIYLFFAFSVGFLLLINVILVVVSLSPFQFNAV